MDDPTPNVVDLDTAARLTGMSRKAIARRIERGQVPSVLLDRRRHVAVNDLIYAGLLDPTTTPPGAAVEPDSHGEGESPAPRPTTAPDLLAVLRDELAAQRADIARQAEEMGRLRLLTEQADSIRTRLEQEQAEADRLRAEVLELRARLAAAEAAEPPATSPSPPANTPRRGILARILGG